MALSAAAAEDAAKKKKPCSYPECKKNGVADKVCGKCLKRAYCCEECQQSDWPEHYKTCFVIPDADSELVRRVQAQLGQEYTMDDVKGLLEAMPDELKAKYAEAEESLRRMKDTPFDIATYARELADMIEAETDEEQKARIIQLGERIADVPTKSFLNALFHRPEEMLGILREFPFSVGLVVQESRAYPGRLGLFTQIALPPGKEITMHGMQAVIMTAGDVTGLPFKLRQRVVASSVSSSWLATAFYEDSIRGKIDQYRHNVYFPCGISAISAYYPVATDRNRKWLASMAVDPALVPGTIIKDGKTYAEFCSEVATNPRVFADAFDAYNQRVRYGCNAAICLHDKKNYCSLFTSRSIAAGSEILVPAGFSSVIQQLSLEGTNDEPNYTWVAKMMQVSFGMAVPKKALRDAGLPCVGDDDMQIKAPAHMLGHHEELMKMAFLDKMTGECVCPACTEK